MRYESIELSASTEAGQKDSDDSCQSMSTLHTSEAVDMDTADGDQENIDINIRQSKHIDHTQGDYDEELKCAEEESYVITENSETDVAEGEVTEITLTTDSQGRYIITTHQNMGDGESQCIPMPENKEFEDSMYNLQMLGEVALKNQTAVEVIDNPAL